MVFIEPHQDEHNLSLVKSPPAQEAKGKDCDSTGGGKMTTRRTIQAEVDDSSEEEADLGDKDHRDDDDGGGGGTAKGKVIIFTWRMWIFNWEEGYLNG